MTSLSDRWWCRRAKQSTDGSVPSTATLTFQAVGMVALLLTAGAGAGKRLAKKTKNKEAEVQLLP
eukprot:COSAG04_NODE_6275_length_1367_cov_1.249211_1_plen_65_part_00